ncbi:MAG: hypothetical protein LRS48_05710 [Desulfurococcales archaeon]|nr:hypothetical protein [Desulfurococcales archaeon]
MSEPVWVDRHIVNIVYESLKRLSKNGEIPVEEEYIYDEVARNGLHISRRELAKILITLEILGRVSVEASGPRKEYRVKLLR